MQLYAAVSRIMIPPLHSEPWLVGRSPYHLVVVTSCGLKVRLIPHGEKGQWFVETYLWRSKENSTQHEICKRV